MNLKFMSRTYVARNNEPAYRKLLATKASIMLKNSSEIRPDNDMPNSYTDAVSASIVSVVRNHG
jgi:hypothetical protein